MDKRTSYLCMLEDHKAKRTTLEARIKEYLSDRMTEVEKEIYLSNLKYLNKRISFYQKKLKEL